MKNTKYKSKKFLFPILFLVLASILLVASVGGYITLSQFKTHMAEHFVQSSATYTRENKERVKREVQAIRESIDFEISKLERALRASLKEKVLIALDLAQYTYDTYKDTLNPEQIKEKIAKTLENVSFDAGRGYYYAYDFETKAIFLHPLAKFDQKDMTNFTDAKGQNIMQLDALALSKDPIAYNKIYFNKPENQNKEFPKITCITKFEPLDLVLGIGEYLDVVEQGAKQDILDKYRGFREDKYITILDVHDIKGGDAFATVLINANRPDLEGKTVSDQGLDVKGNRFRKDLLDVAVQKGEGYSEYWYKKPSLGVPELKISYVYFQKDWNWIIISGFYYDDLKKQILEMKQALDKQNSETINKTLLLVGLLSLCAIGISVFVSLKIDKTIKAYTDQIIEHESLEREQQSKLLEQSKLASMGEMVGNIAHQWRQPLTVISMIANNIKLDVDLDEVSNEDLVKYADDISKQSIYLSQTIEDFKNYIRGDREKKSFNLTECIQSFIHLVDAPIKNNMIHVELQLQNDIQVLGHKNELIQCLINIFNNAKDALKENTQSDDARLVFVTTAIQNDQVSIQIKDNAGGIAQDIMSKIFEPYFTTKHNARGTGLGLYMTHELIVKGMGGSIEVRNEEYVYESKNYKGAVFTIILPKT